MLKKRENKEVLKIEGLTASADSNAVSATFVNSRTDEPQRDKVTLKFTKTWIDFNNVFGSRPDSDKFNLVLRRVRLPSRADRATTLRRKRFRFRKKVSKKLLTEIHGTYTYKNLDKYAPNGTLWTYTIQEEKPKGYGCNRKRKGYI